MKTILVSLIPFLCCFSMATSAQIPNSGFEYWTSGDPDNWATSNAFPAGLINVTQTTEKHSGSYALLGEVVNFLGIPTGPVIQSGPAAAGFPVSEQYHSLELYYKFTSVGGDKFSVIVELDKAGNPIALGSVALPSTVVAYTHIIVPLTYTTSDVPDLAIIQILITGPVTGSDYHIGSAMLVDDLLFSLSTGVESNSVPELIGSAYPNPASDLVNIPLDETVSGKVIFSVFNSFGKEVKKSAGLLQQNGKKVLQVPVVDLPSGIYVCSIIGQDKQYQVKFIVNR